MWLTHHYRWNNKWGNYKNISIESVNNSIKNVSGYDYLKHFKKQYQNKNQGNLMYTLEGKPLSIGINPLDSNLLFIAYDHDTLQFDMHTIYVEQVHHLEKTTYREVSLEEMTFIKESDQLKVKLEIDRIGMKKKGDTLRYNYVNGDVYLKIKDSIR